MDSSSSPVGDAYEGGSGPTLVLLHGLGGTWHVWKPVLALLERRHRVIAPTLPGHPGGPPIPDGVTPTVDVLADLLIADLKARGISGAHVAGNSLGGWLALELARRGVADSVTALSPAGGWQTQQDYDAIARSFRIVYALLPLLIFVFSLFMAFGFIRRLLNKQAMEHGDRVPVSESRRAMRSMRDTTMLPSLLDSMKHAGGIQPFKVDPPLVRIAWCERDKVIPYSRYGAALTTVVRGAEAVKVTGCGHVPMYDDPQQVADVITATTTRAEQHMAAWTDGGLR
jgi:pimeloyl-ACP methyl ester carboxylesterase